jgi:hypothetical protein
MLKVVPLGGPPDQHYYWFLVAYSFIAAVEKPARISGVG